MALKLDEIHSTTSNVYYVESLKHVAFAIQMEDVPDGGSIWFTPDFMVMVERLEND